MSPSELLNIIKSAKGDVEKLNRIIDVFDILTDDFGFVRYSHDTYLPAIREYLRGKPTADYRFKEARVRRARKAGVRRWLYHHQRETFEGVINLLCSLLPVPEFLIDQLRSVMIEQLWSVIKNTEIGMFKRFA